MKNILITQRVSKASSYDERRDAIDQRWINFLMSIDLFPILLANNINYVKKIVSLKKIDGVLLTGGESIVKYGGDSPERDEVDFFLVNWAIENNIPLLGVCRGMQVVQDYYKNELFKIPNHVAVRHSLDVENNFRLSKLLKKYIDVNSYHEYGSNEASFEINKIACSPDGIVMAIEHQIKNVYGVMWHMEREFPFCKTDQELFNFIFS